MKNFLDPAMLRISASLAALGAVIALLAALIGGGSPVEILYRPFLYGFIMSLLGVAVYFILSLFVPEVLKEMRAEEPVENGSEEPEYSGNEEQEPETEMPADGTLPDMTAEDAQSALGDDELKTKSSAAAKSARNAKRAPKEGEIDVEGVAIKNEPEVMAEAIKHLMDQDED